MIITKMGVWPISCGTSVGSFTNELEMVPLGWRRQQEPASYTERELNNYRIGSDPPTVNASLRAVGNNNHRSAMSEQELRCDSGNWSYFHRDVSLNRRSEEGWRDRNSVLGEIGDSRSVSEAENGSGSWFSSNTEVSEAEPERVQGLVYLVEDGLHGLQGFRLADFRNELLGNFQTVASPASVLGASLPRKSRNSAFLSNHNQCYYYCYHAYGGGIGMEYAASPCTSFIAPNSHVGLGYPIRHNEVDTRYTLRRFRSSLLEEFHIDRKNFSRLSEIAGNIVKFSTDKDGSRFIQQKLETASTEEKIMVYTEIEPYALELMNDVYGNYVIQKILEHGIDTQRRELASMLNGRVLTFSRTIYGCRVIQKAIEVADLDQKIKIIQEFDGYIMECVHDQNANHVIQKCIKCVPEKHIQFIFESFFDQVALLSTHPYGCRVIQVLVHCKDPWTRRKVIKEILDSVSMLAQDQYGNYVVQHVIEHGKPHERSAVIMKLAGEIVEMSQQKYASNVVEKCLYYGNAQEREILVNEMLVCTADYDPLQVMMKDQFANYVVQKALDVCSDQQMKHIVSRCFASFNVLKKYTYAKHIVSRVENLTATGERRMVGQNSGRA